MASPQRAPPETGLYYTFRGDAGEKSSTLCWISKGGNSWFPVRRDDIWLGGNKDSMFTWLSKSQEWTRDSQKREAYEAP